MRDTPPRRMRPWLVIGAAAGLVVAGVVAIWFQPQKLFLDERVEESVPVATRPSAAPGTSSPAPGSDATTELSSGEFVSIDHHTSGRSRLIRLADGSRVVRLEGLDTSNGPDLYLYLSTNPTDGEEGRFDDDVVSLGRLKGNRGDQNYEVPAAVDLKRFASVVIWCDRFNSAFGAAPLRLA